MGSEPGLRDSKDINCFRNYKISERGSFLTMERMLVVARRMLCLTTGPGFILTSPASSRINANLNVGVERGIGSNFRLKQRLRHDRLCIYVKNSCVLIYFEGVEMTSDQCASLLHKVKSWLLKAAEQHNSKTLNMNSGDI